MRKFILIVAAVFAVPGLTLAANDCAIRLYSTAGAQKDALPGGGSLTALPGSVYGEDCAGGTTTVKFSRGSIFIKAGTDRVAVKCSGKTIEAGQAVFFTDGGVVDVYGGTVAVIYGKNRRNISAGGSFDLKSKKAVPQNVPGKFPADCLEKERYSSFIQCALDPGYYGLARNVFSGTSLLSAETGRVYFSFDTNSAVRDIDVTMTVENSGAAGLDLKGSARNDETGELIGSISAYRKTSPPASAQDIQSLLADAAMQLSRDIYDYDARLSGSGADIYVEAGGFDKDEYGELKGLLGGLPGVMSIRSDEYYGQKAVYAIKYRGFGADMAMAISTLKLKKSHINIWNYSKFVVKLSNK
jgi:hypothetical protein